MRGSVRNNMGGDALLRLFLLSCHTGTWNMTVGVGPVLSGGLHLADMHITQEDGSRNFSLFWRNGHVSGGHAHAAGTMIGNHSMKTNNNTPHFNWGVDLTGTVTASPYTNYDNPSEKAPDCTLITFCTSCCPKPGPGCCCVSNSSASSSNGINRPVAVKTAHGPDTPQPRVVVWCKKPFCPYKLVP